MSKKIFLCAISNISSGHCLEDCKFCAQSVKHGAKIERFYHKPIKEIIKEAKEAKKKQAVGFCLVTSGKKVDDKILRFVCKAAETIKKEVEELSIIACNGIADKEQLRLLRDHGVSSYNHNLETSQAFYPNICTTHKWKERYETCENVKKAGLKLCTGGIFGLGESVSDRISLLESIKSLEPQSVPLNFFHPNDALPIQKKIILKEDALEVIRTARKILGNDRRIMIAGGREVTFKDEDYKIFEAGADAIVIGNYLTTKGNDPMRDHRMIKSHGYKIASNCDD